MQTLMPASMCRAAVRQLGGTSLLDAAVTGDVMAVVAAAMGGMESVLLDCLRDIDRLGGAAEGMSWECSSLSTVSNVSQSC